MRGKSYGDFFRLIQSEEVRMYVEREPTDRDIFVIGTAFRALAVIWTGPRKDSFPNNEYVWLKHNDVVTSLRCSKMALKLPKGCCRGVWLDVDTAFEEYLGKHYDGTIEDALRRLATNGWIGGVHPDLDYGLSIKLQRY